MRASAAGTIRAAAVVWRVVVWRVVVCRVVVCRVVVCRVVVDSAAGAAVMVVADRALTEADGAVRAAAVPDGRSTGRAG